MLLPNFREKKQVTIILSPFDQRMFVPQFANTTAFSCLKFKAVVTLEEKAEGL